MTIPRNLSFLAQGASSTGVLSVPYGGTGLTTLTAGYIPYGNGTGALGSSANLNFDGANLGLSLTPSAWRSNTPAFQIAGSGISLFSDSGVAADLANNVYLNASSQYIYQRTDGSSRYQQYQGIHKWYTAPSGTAGTAATFTQAMQIANSGGVSIGNTTDPGATNLSVTGRVNAANLNGPAFIAVGNAFVSATTATFTKISYAVTSYDSNSNYSAANSRFTPSVAGYYQINAQIQCAGSATGAILLAIFVNGNWQVLGNYIPLSLIGPALQVNSMIYMNGTTDYVEIYGYQNSGANLDIGANANQLTFSGALVRAA